MNPHRNYAVFAQQRKRWLELHGADGRRVALRDIQRALPGAVKQVLLSRRDSLEAEHAKLKLLRDFDLLTRRVTDVTAGVQDEHGVHRADRTAVRVGSAREFELVALARETVMRRRERKWRLTDAHQRFRPDGEELPKPGTAYKDHTFHVPNVGSTPRTGLASKACNGGKDNVACYGKMAKRVLERARFRGFTDEEWKRIGRYLAEPPKKFMNHVLGNAVAISYTKALAIMLALYDDGLAELSVQVFHKCEEHPVAQFDIQQQGIVVSLPWECPECERVVRDEGELRYDWECMLTEPVEVV